MSYCVDLSRFVDSNSIRDFLLNQTPEARKLFDCVNDKVISKWSQGIDFGTVDDTDFPFGNTLPYKLSVSIRLRSCMPKNKLKSVFVHELGEADYIASGFPVPYTTNDEIIDDLLMTFSHSYIRMLLDRFELIKLDVSQLIDAKPETIECQAKADLYGWKEALHYCKLLSTYPGLRRYRDIMPCYDGGRKVFETCLCIISEPTIFQSAERAFESMQRFIAELQGKWGNFPQVTLVSEPR